jgi:hypothetical protein
LCEALLIAQTADGYAAAMSNLTKFVNEKPDREFLESWLKWWDDRKEFIFNAFTPSDGPSRSDSRWLGASRLQQFIPARGCKYGYTGFHFIGSSN